MRVTSGLWWCSYSLPDRSRWFFSIVISIFTAGPVLHYHYFAGETGHFSIVISRFTAGPVLNSHYFAGETGEVVSAGSNCSGQLGTGDMDEKLGVVSVCGLPYPAVGIAAGCAFSAGEFLLIYICNFHVLCHFLLIYICKLHWNQRPSQSLATSTVDDQGRRQYQSCGIALYM